MGDEACCILSIRQARCPTLCRTEPEVSERSEGLPNTRNEGGVVRVGDTVRRPTGPWTPAVHALRTYLHESGYGFAPRPLGIDEAGREILTYIEGDTEMTPGSFARRVRFDALPEAARRLRQLHDLTAAFDDTRCDEGVAATSQSRRCRARRVPADAQDLDAQSITPAGAS